MPQRDLSPVTTMLGLLGILYCDMFGHRKIGAVVNRSRLLNGPDKITVEEFFDDGKGHSGAFTSQSTSVEPGIFQEALSRRFITGLLKPGYVSDIEFEITDDGRHELFRLRIEARESAFQAESTIR